LFLFGYPKSTFADTLDMDIVVNATELSRKLIHSQITFDMPNKTALLYPKWWLGHHGPVGAIENIAGLRFTDANGETIQWERDWTDVFRFFLDEKPGNSLIQANLTYICNQPTDNTIGCDSYGYPQIGIINWNTIAIYPEGVPIHDITVHLKLVLPTGWQYGSALPFDYDNGDTLVFKPVTFEEFIDMPLICGTNFRTVKYASTKMADYYLHIAADDDEFLPKNDSTFIAFTRMADEAEALFGRTHFDEYHFLLTVSDFIPGSIGLEHRNSSLNGVKANVFEDPQKHNPFLWYVMPHEFVHAWCGKYRRPTGMNTPDYQTTKNMDMLWIYEGLDQYLGVVLMTRSRFVTFDELLDERALWWGWYFNQQGRLWRSLRDTQVANYTIRTDSESWGFLRRNQDYYEEGAMIWLEFDARIRSATNGAKSLDDFCATFFGTGDTATHAISFELTDIISSLGELADLPWAALIDQKINGTEKEFDPEGIRQSGYTFTFTAKKSDILKWQEDEAWEHKVYHKSVGLTVNEDGVVGEVVPDGPADQSGLYDGVKVVGVNGKTFNYERFENAVRNTTTIGKLTLLILEADTFQEYEIDYDGGLRYDKLEPVDGKRDWLKEIMAPKVSK
jgi:predicted metalloprotease with PDZ domain